MKRQPMGELGVLVKLPLEIREMIYHYVFVGGVFKVRQLSKAVYCDSSPTFFKTVTCTINIGVDEASPPPRYFPSQKLVDKFQNFRINVGYFEFLEFYRGRTISFTDLPEIPSWQRCKAGERTLLLRLLNNPSMRHRSCLFSFLLHWHCKSKVNQQVLEILRGLYHFEDITIDLRVEKLPPRHYHDGLSIQNLKSVSQEVNNFLEPALGRVETNHKIDDSPFRLQYTQHPRMYFETLKRKVESQAGSTHKIPSI